MEKLFFSTKKVKTVEITVEEEHCLTLLYFFFTWEVSSFTSLVTHKYTHFFILLRKCCGIILTRKTVKEQSLFYKVPLMIILIPPKISTLKKEKEINYGIPPQCSMKNY